MAAMSKVDTENEQGGQRCGNKIDKKPIWESSFVPVYANSCFDHYSFNESKSRGQWGGFTLKWYGEMFDPDIIKALYYTF